MKRFIIGSLAALGLLGAIASPAALAQDRIDDGPSAEAIVFDLAIARPAGLVGTIVGAVVLVVALPFTITIGAPPADAAQALVVDPFAFTFTRPLGED